MVNLLKFIVFLSLALTVFSCSKSDDDKADCSGIAPTYTKDIAPLYNANCATSGCHGAVFPAVGINLSNYSTAKAASQNDKLLKSIKHQSGASPMPKGGGAKLSDANIRLIECWIRNGFPE